MRTALSIIALAQSEGGLPKVVMDWFEIGSKTVAIVAGVIVAWKGIAELRNSRIQREVELRWKQANMARDIIRDMHDHPHAKAACEILDWGASLHEYHLPGTDGVQISGGDVLDALSKPRSQASGKADECIWTCFDWFFYYVDRIEHHIESNLIRFEDVWDVFRPYVAKIRSNESVYWPLINEQDYRNVARFFDRFGEPRQGGM